ncbi:endonuclease G [Sphingomonas sp. PP-F2F-A104-K0414]|uniref:DNA/RNA non-specific endonuclease n=1 Tax=Sphingomonas sp. PP-F2F-A104-K0414 TaxID=2135661 RepID=UPI0010477FA6|nr:DNA/RNA non-specific endonuclease [Sphingomonas sp. PP-F2F-A104-K0414]TCP97475.1 endonuclease G [Sphingomonas sp. PP-F2F-A104-K0414]
MIDLSYRPRLADLRTLSPQSLGLLPFEREGVRTSDAVAFQGRAGYDADFLPGFAVPLPDTGAIAVDVLPVTGSDGDRLDYEHFSILMSKSRRLALFTAVNIDGSASVSVPRGGDPWAFDGRIPEEAQAGDELYADNDFDRGHLVRREDPNWGPTAGVANRDTFHFTNCAPQLSVFNQRSWLSLEDYILGNTRRVGERATVFTGPVFRPNDPVYRGVAIPLAYWKVVAFIHDDGRPSASAYLIDHDVDLGAQSLLFGAFKTYQRSILAIEGLTNLDFGSLRQFDGFSNEEKATGDVVRVLVTEAEDIRL